MIKSSGFFFLFILLPAFFLPARATHIVGGDITYKHLGNDSFEINLILYVDCIKGQPAAIAQDSDAMVGVFDTSGQIVDTLLKLRNGPVRINSVSFNCVSPPSNVCVDEYVYTYYTRLPQRPGGYILAFQRCCRNHSINNITAPGNTGATYWTRVPEAAWANGYNNSAVFNSLPPNFLCINKDFFYDHSATDADGDSLVYELYTPLNGASPSVPLPRPPSGPPFQKVKWNPGFSTDSMMKGNPELHIDARTGLLHVKPGLLGQFVVGIVVKEYRNGKNISATYRDFQFNVLNCQINIVSAFSKNIKVCSDTVRFSNQSVGADTYLWNFGDDSLSTDTSTGFEPTYVYKRTGTYQVKLKVSKGNCADSTYLQVTIDKDLARFAGPDTVICKGSSVRLGTAGSGQFVYSWKPSEYLDDDSAAQPLCSPAQSIQYIVTRSSDICVNTDTINIKVKSLKADYAYKWLESCKELHLLVDSPQAAGTALWQLNQVPVSFDELRLKRFAYNQEYTLRMTITDTVCIDSVEKSIRAGRNNGLDKIPNVFTPNGDPWNECYQIKNVELTPECSRLWVYNRWGELLFDSNTDGPCWNGKAKGSDLSDGVYFYILEHEGRSLHGNITLIR